MREIKSKEDIYRLNKKDILKKMNEKRYRERQRQLKGGPKTKEFNLDPTMRSVSGKSRSQQAFERSLAGSKSTGFKRKADTKGLKGGSVTDMVKKPAKITAKRREGESMIAFMNRVNREKNILLKESENNIVVKKSEKKREYIKNLKMKKQEKKAKKKYNRLLDQEFEGRPEEIPFGEVAERPPSFDDIQMPTNKKNNARASNLAVLNEALANADADVRAKYGLLQEAMNDNSDDDDDGKEGKPAKVSAVERQRMLNEAREAKRKAEVEKVRMQALMAYREVKARRGNRGMSSLMTHGATLKRGADAAMSGLRSVDRGSL